MIKLEDKERFNNEIRREEINLTAEYLADLGYTYKDILRLIGHDDIDVSSAREIVAARFAMDYRLSEL